MPLATLLPLLLLLPATLASPLVTVDKVEEAVEADRATTDLGSAFNGLGTTNFGSLLNDVINTVLAGLHHHHHQQQHH